MKKQIMREKNIETLWCDYRKIVDLCGENSEEAISMLKVVNEANEILDRHIYSEAFKRAIKNENNI